MIGGDFDTDYERCASCQRLVHAYSVRRDCNDVLLCPECYARVDPTADHVPAHDFEPLRFWDAWHANGRCLMCLRPKWAHPTRYHADMRQVGDMSRARLPGASR